MPPNSYCSNTLSIFCFCPFKSFCLSCKLSRSLQSDFMRFNCALTSSRQSGSIVYIPLSDCVSHYCLILSAPTRISSQSDCELPHPYHTNLFPKVFSHTAEPWLSSPYLSLYQFPYLLISKARFGRLFTFSARSKALECSTTVPVLCQNNACFKETLVSSPRLLPVVYGTKTV